MNRELWLELNEAAQVSRLSNLTAEHVINAFLANYAAALVLMRMHDVETAALLRDPNGAKMDGFKNNMSDPNFWGYAALNPEDKYVVAKLGRSEAQRLQEMAGRISDTTARKILNVLQTPPDLLNWNEVYFILVLLRERYSVNSSYLNRISSLLSTWALRSRVEQLLAVSNAFQYLLQSDPRSRLLPRLRELNQGELVNAATTGVTNLKGFFRMFEDDGGGAAVAVGTSAANIGTTSSGLTNVIITPPGYQTVTDSESQKLARSDDNAVARLYQKKLGKQQRHARFAKLKAMQKRDNKVVRKKKRDFLPRTFKDPELNDVLGDHSNVRAA